MKKPGKRHDLIHRPSPEATRFPYERVKREACARPFQREELFIGGHATPERNEAVILAQILADLVNAGAAGGAWTIPEQMADAVSTCMLALAV